MLNSVDGLFSCRGRPMFTVGVNNCGALLANSATFLYSKKYVMKNIHEVDYCSECRMSTERRR
jgi:hypothetical protein